MWFCSLRLQWWIIEGPGRGEDSSLGKSKGANVVRCCLCHHPQDRARLTKMMGLLLLLSLVSWGPCACDGFVVRVALYWSIRSWLVLVRGGYCVSVAGRQGDAMRWWVAKAVVGWCEFVKWRHWWSWAAHHYPYRYLRPCTGTFTGIGVMYGPGAGKRGHYKPTKLGMGRPPAIPIPGRYLRGLPNWVPRTHHGACAYTLLIIKFFPPQYWQHFVSNKCIFWLIESTNTIFLWFLNNVII